MKITLPNYDKSGIGGGWSWISNFNKVMKENITEDYQEADIFLIPSASMVSRDDVLKAKADGKKVVLRCDNIIKNSRNRNTGMTRMKDFAEWADLVIFQSEFAKKLLGNYLFPSGITGSTKIATILNSVDQDIFNTDGRTDSLTRRLLYSKYSSDPTKNWDLARMAFQEYTHPDKSLTLVGRFDGGLDEYNFDFYQDEVVNYAGLISDPGNMAKVYKSSDVFLFSYFQDACSNTLIEALSCGLQIHDCYGMLNTGGSPEIMEKLGTSPVNFMAMDTSYFALPRMGGDYYKEMAKL